MQHPGYQWLPALVALFLVFGASNDASADLKKAPGQNQCVICHTNVKGLIRLSWEVEKRRPQKGQSIETSGEG